MNKKICVLMCAVSIASVCGLRGMDNPPGELGYFYRYDHYNDPYWTPEDEKVEKKEKKKSDYYTNITDKEMYEKNKELYKKLVVEPRKKRLEEQARILPCKKVFDSEKELVDFIKNDQTFCKFFQKKFVKEQEWEKKIAKTFTDLTPVAAFLSADENFLIALLKKEHDSVWGWLQIFNMKTKTCEYTEYAIKYSSLMVYDKSRAFLAIGEDWDNKKYLKVYYIKFDCVPKPGWDPDTVKVHKILNYQCEEETFDIKEKPFKKKAENIKKIFFTETSLIVITQKYDDKYYLYSCSIEDLEKRKKD